VPLWAGVLQAAVRVVQGSNGFVFSAAVKVPVPSRKSGTPGPLQNLAAALGIGFCRGARFSGGQLHATSEAEGNHKRFLTEGESENL